MNYNLKYLHNAKNYAELLARLSNFEAELRDMLVWKGMGGEASVIRKLIKEILGE